MDVSPNKKDHTIAFQSKRPKVKTSPTQVKTSPGQKKP
jgi:hypothetical protein